MKVNCTELMNKVNELLCSIMEHLVAEHGYYINYYRIVTGSNTDLVFCPDSL